MKLKCLHVILLVFLISLLDLFVFKLLDLRQTQPQHSFHMATNKSLDSSLVEQSLEDNNSSPVEQSLQENNYSLSDLPPKSALWTDKIHLCINFNLNGIKPNKQVTETLMSYYLPFFKKITLIFDGYWSRPDYVPELVDFISCDSHIGWYQHKCIRTCIQRGSEETKGFLYIADDMFINLTKMAELPTTKLWMVDSEVCSYSKILNLGHPGCEWPWWGPPTNGAKNLDIVIKSLPAKWKEQLVKTAGFPDHFKSYCTSDIIYIPQALVTDMTHVLDHIINTAKLFCEIATILAVNIVARNRTTLVNGYLWGDKSMAAIKQRATTAHFVHPVKLGLQAYLDIWIQFMEKELSINNRELQYQNKST
ncbi:uncharacterized protein LOC135331756 [Halichondria panicea]|uniref:uncharacterized protein LOC135331756 n=1 Tax=Halichondria panicea TaxID=6063 RepID=UPI00312B5C1D